LEYKVFGIVDARCNREVATNNVASL